MQGIDTRIRDRMVELNISVNALAESAAIPRMTLTRRLADPSGLTLAEVERIAQALKTGPIELMVDTQAVA